MNDVFQFVFSFDLVVSIEYLLEFMNKRTNTHKAQVNRSRQKKTKQTEESVYQCKIKLETYFYMSGLERIDVNMHKLISKQIKNKAV